MRHLAEVLDPADEMRLDVLREILDLLRVLLLACKLERQPRLARDRDRPVRALVGAHAAEEEQVVAAVRLAGIEREVERVRAVGDPRQVRLRLALVERDRDEADPPREVGDPLVHLSRLAVERPVQRVHDRCLDEAPGERRDLARVVVDDVELVRPPVAGEGVPELGKRLADPLARRVREDRLELRLRARVAGREERHVVARVGEPVREERDDPLDPAVAARRHREPGRREDGDSHRASTSTVPRTRRTSQARSKARTPESRMYSPAQEGISGGANVSRSWRRRFGWRPSSTWTSRTGAPAAHACGRAAVG